MVSAGPGPSVGTSSGKIDAAQIPTSETAESEIAYHAAQVLAAAHRQRDRARATPAAARRRPSPPAEPVTFANAAGRTAPWRRSRPRPAPRTPTRAASAARRSASCRSPSDFTASHEAPCTRIIESPSTPMMSANGLKPFQKPSSVKKLPANSPSLCERYAENDVAHGDAEQQRRKRAAAEERPVPDARPTPCRARGTRTTRPGRSARTARA